MKAMYVGISGMAAQQQALNVVSNNISNSQTNGFKKQNTEFEELFYQQYKAPVATRRKYAGRNPIEIGNGVKVGAVTTNHEQGSVKYTGKRTDMSIEGNGYFVLGDHEGSVTGRTYTRDGGFKLSVENELVSKDGKYVLGWNVDRFTGKVNTGAIIEPIKMEIGDVYNPRATENVGLTGNLDADAEVGDRYGIQVPSFDSLGERHDINFDFIKLENNGAGEDRYKFINTVDDQYFQESSAIRKAVLNPSSFHSENTLNQTGDYTIRTTYVPGALGDPNVPVGNPGAGSDYQPGMRRINVIGPGGSTLFTQDINDVSQTVTLQDGNGSLFTLDYKSDGNEWATQNATFTVAQQGEITFDSKGVVKGITPTTIPQISYTPQNSSAQDVVMDVDMSQFTGLDVDSGISIQEQDGYGAAILENFAVEDGGRINGFFDDGTMRPIASLSLATFKNPEGLSRAGGSQFAETPNSGLAEIGTSNTGIRGVIKGESIETSNVDLAKEFVDMLVTQKAFTANTKVIRTSDDVLNSVLTLIR